MLHRAANLRPTAKQASARGGASARCLEGQLCHEEAQEGLTEEEDLGRSCLPAPSATPRRRGGGEREAREEAALAEVVAAAGAIYPPPPTTDSTTSLTPPLLPLSVTLPAEASRRV
jgi:hypothetical protein